MSSNEERTQTAAQVSAEMDAIEQRITEEVSAAVPPRLKQEPIMRSGIPALMRRLRRALWLALHFATHAASGALELFARHIVFLRAVLRKRLVMPLNAISRTASAHANKLPPPTVPSISTMHVETRAKDGVILMGTLYLPVPPDPSDRDGTPLLDRSDRFSTVLMRTPYGRHNLGVEWSRIFAERGYAVLLQDTRGRFGSDGDFFPVKHEMVDGAASIEWIRDQPWSNGRVAIYGVSYLGLTAFAAAGGAAPGSVAAVVPVMACARSFPILYHHGSGSFALDLVLRWLWLATKLMNTPRVVQFWVPFLQAELNSSFLEGPLGMQDEKLLGQRLDFLQDAIRATDAKHEFWQDKDVLCDLAAPQRPPMHVVAGWYDFFAKQSFEDFARAQSSTGGAVCKLTVGCWGHWDFLSYGGASVKLALAWFDKYVGTGSIPKAARGENAFHDGSDDEDEDIEAAATTVTSTQTTRRAGPEEHEHAVHVAFLGTVPTRWAYFAEWPPRSASFAVWTLQRMLADKPDLLLGEGGDSERSRNDYDPRDPTPCLGGPSFDPHNFGRKEQSWLERRSDVLTFTAQPVEDETLFVCGDVYVEVSARSSNPHTDFFFKLCEVHGAAPQRRSYNLVENLLRLGPEDWDQRREDADGRFWYEIRHRRFKLGAIACAYSCGRAVRLQVSGGAHPLYMRNFGTGHDIADAVETRSQQREILHETRLLLPVVDKRDVERHTDRNPAFPEHVVERD